MQSTRTLQYKAVKGPKDGQYLVIEFYMRAGLGECHTDFWMVEASSSVVAIQVVRDCLATEYA